MLKDSDAERMLREIEALAKGWGKLLAEQAFPDGVGLDVDLWSMEEVAVAASKALVGGAIEAMTAAQQAEGLAGEANCPESRMRSGVQSRSSITVDPSARRQRRVERAGGPLLDLSSRFFSLCGPC